MQQTADMVDVTLPVLLFDGNGQDSVVHWPTRLLHMLYPVHIVTVTDYWWPCTMYSMQLIH